MTNYSQRYATGDSNTAGSFYFDTITAVDYPAAKVLWGAEGAVNHCSAANPLPVTAVNGGTFAVQASQSGTWNVTNISGTISLPTGAATAAKQPALGTAGTASADVITIQGIASMTAVKVDGSAVTQPVSGTVTANQGGTWTVQPGNTANTTAWLVTGTGGTFPVTDSGGSLTVDAPVGTPVFVRLSDGASAISTLPVSLASVPSHAVTNAGTFAVQVDGAALTSLQLLDDAVSGTGFNISQINGVNVSMGNGVSGTGVQRVTIANDSTGILAGVTTVTTVTTCSTVTTLTGGGVAHDGVDSGNPHKIGAKATTALSGVTLVANADRTDLYAGSDGVLINRPHCSLEDIVSGNASNTDGTSTQCIAASGVGVKTYLQSVILTNTSASNIYVEIKDGTTVKLTIPVPANGGAVVNLPVPIGGTANTAWNFDPSAATTTVYCSMIGWKSKV